MIYLFLMFVFGWILGGACTLAVADMMKDYPTHRNEGEE
jgi:hypothetical protein